MARNKAWWKPWGDHPFIVISFYLFGVISSYAAINQIYPRTVTIINSKCIAFQEAGGKVVIDADQYTLMLPGKESTISRTGINRNASDIVWKKNQNFTGIMEALPDTYSTNTMSDTNGPALIYLIDFKKAGKYFVYIRGFGEDGDGDSVHVGLSGQAVTTKFENGFVLESSFKEPRWFWKTNKNQTTSIEIPHPGLYTFYVWARENGVKVQRIWLDVNPDNVQNGEVGNALALSQCVNSE